MIEKASKYDRSTLRVVFIFDLVQNKGQNLQKMYMIGVTKAYMFVKFKVSVSEATYLLQTDLWTDRAWK